MNRELADAVRIRADGRCEYCRLASRYYPAPFQIDHIIARQHSGASELSNLALACLHCNVRKGPNVSGIDARDGLTRLYHPLRDVWAEHFAWNGAALIGKTAVGRVTVQVLGINEPDFMEVRAALMRERAFDG